MLDISVSHETLPSFYGCLDALICLSLTTITVILEFGLLLSYRFSQSIFLLVFYQNFFRQVYGRVPLIYEAGPAFSYNIVAYPQAEVQWVADDDECPEESGSQDESCDEEDDLDMLPQVNAIFFEKPYEEEEKEEDDDWRDQETDTAIPQSGTEIINVTDLFSQATKLRSRPRTTRGLNIVFTDGSFVSPNKSGYGIFMGMGHPLNRAVRLAEPHSSARAEIQAMLQSLLVLLKWNDRPEAEVNIYTDCLFAIQALHHVRARRMRKKEPRMDSNNRECLEHLISSLNEEFNVLITLAHRFEEGVRISFIKSHCGEYGNERFEDAVTVIGDTLCSSFADLYATIGRTGDVRNAMRLKSWNDTPYDIIRRINNRPYIHFQPTKAERNMSQLVLNIDDRKNCILYPQQQIVWSPDHPSITEHSIKCGYD